MFDKIMAKNAGINQTDSGIAKAKTSIPTDLRKAYKKELKSIKRIETQLLVKVWVSDRDIGHKLFNFHEGYQTLPEFTPIIGSRKYSNHSITLLHSYVFTELRIVFIIVDIIS